MPIDPNQPSPGQKPEIDPSIPIESPELPKEAPEPIPKETPQPIPPEAPVEKPLEIPQPDKNM